MTAPTLSPCPFCGGVNIIYNHWHAFYCHGCGVEGPDADNRDEAEALAAWNDRASPPAADGSNSVAADAGPAGSEAETGDLDPRRALDYARQMKTYCDAFNDRNWSSEILYGNVDTQNLATALDNLTECAAMLMNMASRLSPPLPAPSEPASGAVQVLREALEGLMELERRGRFMPVGREWDKARAALASTAGATVMGAGSEGLEVIGWQWRWVFPTHAGSWCTPTDGPRSIIHGAILQGHPDTHWEVRDVYARATPTHVPAAVMEDKKS